MAKSESIPEPKAGKYEDVMPDMDEDEFERLAASIERDGLKNPIEIDENGHIVDGHHRHKACKSLGITPKYTVVDDADTERAFRANVTRRNLSDGQLRQAVEDYLEDHYDGDRSQRELADDLGVSVSTVNRALSNITPTPSGVSAETLSTEDRKSAVNEYLKENPDASNREVAANLDMDVSHTTVAEWREASESEDGADAGATTADAESADGQNSETSDSERTESSESESEHIQPDDSGVSVDEAAELLDGAKPTSDGADQDGPGPAAGDPSDPDEESDSQRVTELEALLEARNDRIEELETRLRYREEVMLEGGDATIDALGRIVDELNLPIDAETHPPRAIANRIIDTIERLRADRADLREQVEAQRNQLNEFEKRREEIVVKSEQLIDAIQDKDPRNVDVYAEELEGVL